MAADIEQRTGVKPQLVKGARGAFEVKVDDRLVFSKLGANRFPEHREVLAQLPER